MRNPLTALVRRPAESAGSAPLAIPDRLADVESGLLLVRAGPAGPDVADLNHTAAALLGAAEADLLGNLLTDCPGLRRTPGLVVAVDLLTRGTATGWRGVVHGADGQPLTLTIAAGPTRDSVLLQLGPTTGPWWAAPVAQARAS